MASDMKTFFNAFLTKTTWSAIAGAAAYVSQHDTHNPMTWVNAIIGVLTVVSARAAITTSGPATP